MSRQDDQPNLTLPPQRAPTTDEELCASHVVAPTPLNGTVFIAAYDPAWPRMFAAEAATIRGTLGARALLLEHAGSTSVPGLPAKPLIDIVLVVADPTDEAAYVPPLEAAGYALRIREPEWYQHRVLKRLDPEVNLHVFGPDCEETRRMLAFRDWLRAHDADRDLYARTKRELARREWKYVQHYADAKSDVVREILARAIASADVAQKAHEFTGQL